MKKVIAYHMTMEELREKYEYGAEALVGRTMGDKEFLQWLNNNLDIQVSMEPNKKNKYIVKESS